MGRFSVNLLLSVLMFIDGDNKSTFINLKKNEKTFTNELSNPYINLKFYDYNYTVVNYTVVNIIDD